MTPLRRWLLVGVGLVLLITTPLAIRALPVDDSEISAAELLRQVQGSGSVAYSGYAEAVGGLQLPVTDRFSDLATLLGERTRLRVWWRSADNWRVDALSLTGETDLVRDLVGMATWEYEPNRVTYTDEVPVRLPRSADLVPAVLARHLLGEARPDEVSRLPTERIAGHEAPGLRLTPADPRTTIDHADVWVERDSGVALRVAVYGAGGVSTAVTTSFRDLTLAPPDPATTAFYPPQQAEVQFDDAVDIAAAADRFAPFLPPERLAGLKQRAPRQTGAVGDYGRGVTRLVAIPLRAEDAGPVRDQLLGAVGVRDGRRGTSLFVGPLGLLLTPADASAPNWLLVGTVTRRTLLAAAEDLATGVGIVR